MGDFGMKVSLPGFNVGAATPKQLVYSSKYSTFTIFAAGSGSAHILNNSPTWSTTLVTIAHNLGYRPAFIVYSVVGSAMQSVFTHTDGSTYFNIPFLFPVGGDASIVPWVDNTNLYILYGGQQGTAGVPEDIPYKYYIYNQKAN